VTIWEQVNSNVDCIFIWNEIKVKSYEILLGNNYNKNRKLRISMKDVQQVRLLIHKT